MEILEEHKVTNVKLMVDMMPKEMFSWALQFVVGILLLLFSVTALGISCSKDCTFCPPKVKEIQCPLIDDPDRNCYSKRMCWSAYFAVSIAAISILISMGAISAATRGIILPTADILLGSIAMSFNLTGIVVVSKYWNNETTFHPFIRSFTYSSLSLFVISFSIADSFIYPILVFYS